MFNRPLFSPKDFAKQTPLKERNRNARKQTHYVKHAKPEADGK